jgi:glycosyltransferase involved in cell wall biosynthesis
MAIQVVCELGSSGQVELGSSGRPKLLKKKSHELPFNSAWGITKFDQGVAIRIFVIDFGLEVPRGHHYSGACVLNAAATRMGIELLVLAPQSLAPIDDLKLAPVLSYGLYDDPLSEKRTTEEFESSLSDRRAAATRDLRSYLSDRIGPDDVAMLNTPMAPEVAGFVDWYESLSDARRPPAVIHFVLPLQYYLAADLIWQARLVAKLYSGCLHRLRTLSRGRCLFLCNDRNLTKQFSSFNLDVKFHPIPIDVLPRDPIPARPLRIGLLGTVRPEKGLQLALETFRQLQKDEDRFNWVIQTSPAKFDNDVLDMLCAPNVEHIDYLPTNDQYIDLLRSLSVVLLPYDPARYANGQSSNIFYEALASGIPVICSETEFFVHELCAIGCSELIFRPYTAEALAQKIRNTARDYSRYASTFWNVRAKLDPAKNLKLLMEMLTTAGNDQRPAEIENNLHKVR